MGWQDGLWRRWPVAERTVRPDGVVVIAPFLDQHLRLRQIVEDFPIQQLVPELAIEALIVAVLPWRAGLDLERVHADTRQPVPHRLCSELAAIIRNDVVRRSMPSK